jgi:hypothetical protein
MRLFKRRRVVREQETLRQERLATTPAMSVKVTIERRQGLVVTSTISGVGPDLAAALWSARGRAANMVKEIGGHLERFPAEEEDL